MRVGEFAEPEEFGFRAARLTYPVFSASAYMRIHIIHTEIARTLEFESPSRGFGYMAEVSFSSKGAQARCSRGPPR